MKTSLLSFPSRATRSGVVVLVVLGLITSASAQSLFSNGTFESDTVGNAPSAWTLDPGEEAGTGAGIQVSMARTSPFTNLNATSTKSLVWIDGSEFNGRPYAETYLGSVANGVYTFNMDFFIDNNVPLQTESGNFVTYLGGSDAAFFFEVNFGGAARVSANGAQDLLTVQQGVWYNVQATVDFTGQVSSGTISNFAGDQTASWSGLAFFSHPGDERAFTITDYGSAAQSPSVYFDNLSLSASAVPEPSTYAAWLGAVALIGGIAWRRRNQPGRAGWLNDNPPILRRDVARPRSGGQRGPLNFWR